MKAKIAQFKKESIEDLNYLLESEKTPAVEKAAIRKVLKEKEAEGEKPAPAKMEAVKDEPKAPAKKAAPKKKAEKKAPAKKADKKPAAKKEKKVGVIATIYNTISESKKPVTEADILAKLKKAFPDKKEKSMTSTIKVQIGSNKRPVRMEREKKVTFNIEDKKGVKFYSIK